MSNATVIEVELLAGRYHAHIWGESQFAMAGPEWPPSPWRLLRALASAWFSDTGLSSEKEDRDRLLENLAHAGPPELWLPKTSFHEIRYYQPVRKGGLDRVRHHDFFAVPEGGRFWFKFDVSLACRERCLLRRLLSRLRYLGRTESRARLRVVHDTEPPPRIERVTPFQTEPSRGDQPHPERSATNKVYRSVLCAKEDFRAYHLWAVPNECTEYTPTAAYPPHLVDTLLDHKMPLPPGARWVEYELPDGLIVHEIPPRSKVGESRPPINVAEIRFRLCRRIPIPLRLLIPVARAFRDAAVARHRALTPAHSLTLTGRKPDGTIARGHRHAYYLPRLSETGAVEGLTVRVPQGSLTREELSALLAVDHIRVDGSPYPITVIPEATIAESTPPQPARRWVSTTPFLPPVRRRSQQHRCNLEEAVLLSMEHLGLGRPASLRRAPGPAGHGSISPLLSHQYLVNVGDTYGRRWIFTKRSAFWLELIFDYPVLLDLPVGADSHFGAGQFKPC